MKKRILACLLAPLVLGTTASYASPVFPEGLKILGEEALCGAVSMHDAVLPDGLEKIESRAFAGSGLRWVCIPDSVTEIADDAFRDAAGDETGSLLVLASADSEAARFVSRQPPEANIRLYTGAARIGFRWKEKLAVGLEFDMDPTVMPAGREVVFASGTASAEVDAGGHVRIVDEGTVAITFTDHEGEHVLVSQDVLPVFYRYDAPESENGGDCLIFRDLDAEGLWQCPEMGFSSVIQTGSSEPVSLPAGWDGRLFVNISGDCLWSAEVTDGNDWILLLRDGGSEKMIDPGSVYHANLNRTGAAREGSVRFSAGGCAYDLAVRQEVPERIVSVVGVMMDCASKAVPVGGVFSLTASVVPANATDPFVIWESSDPAVASAADGEVTALACGTAVICARTADGGRTASCAVTVYPDDDTVCLVCMGYQLNPDGSMKPELIGRLSTLLRVAETFPNAVIVCTGGHTASDNSGATEAGRMAEWLCANGIDPGRIFTEGKSKSTYENAVNTMQLLSERHPQTTRIMIITSDYHMSASVLHFRMVASRTNPDIIVEEGEAWPTGD